MVGWQAGPPTKQQLLDLVARLAGRHVLVVGDLVLDEYIFGRATRLSREAPVPVLEFERREWVPGAAANPASNVQVLGSHAVVVGLVGDDEAGGILIEKLRAAGIDTARVVADPKGNTVTKTRILADSGMRMPQQLLRVDRLRRTALDEALQEKLVANVASGLAGVDALLVSDYKSGVVCAKVVDACREHARQTCKLACVDSQGDLHNFRDFTLVKANQHDAEAVIRRPLGDEDDFRQALGGLLRELHTEAVVITRGMDGISVAQGDHYARVPAAERTEIFDVTGAGDTVIAVLALSLVGGASLLEATYLANLAAGLVVRKLGNVSPTPDELRVAIERSPLLG